MSDEPLRVVVVDPQEDTREQLQRALLSDEEGIWLEAECQVYDVFLDVVQQAMPDVAVISIDADPNDAISVIQKIATSCPSVAIVAVSSQTDGMFIMDLIRKGVKEFVKLPLQPEELLDALDRVNPHKNAPMMAGGGVAVRGPRPTRGGKVVAFAGARGGVGSTSLAVNCGCILAQEPGMSVAMIDLDLVMGDADVCLDIIPDFTFSDVAMSIDRVDVTWLKRAMSKHSSGLYLLPHPVKIEDAYTIDDSHINRVVSLLKRSFSHVLLDLSKSYLATDFTAMELADVIIMVIQLDVSSLNNVIRLFQSLEEKPALLEKIRVVANRVGSDGEITLQKATDTIGQEVKYRIPNDSRTMFASRNNGVPLFKFAPKSKLYLSIKEMTDELLCDRGDGLSEGGAAGGKGGDPKAPSGKPGGLKGFLNWGRGS